MANRKLIVEIIGDDDRYKKALVSSTKATQRFSVGIGTIVKSAAVFDIVSRGIEGISKSVHAGIGEFSEQQKVNAQVNAALKTTQGISNATAKGIDNLALRLSNLSGIDDEVIKSGEGVLLSFTQIRNQVGKGNDIFNRATKAVTDYAVRTGKDVPNAARILGRALADPERKLGALSRAGVVFSKSQEIAIKAMAKSGNLLGAQKVLLQALEQRFKGAAKAAGATLSGQLNILRERFKDLAAKGIGLVAPALTTGVKAITSFVKRISQAQTTRAKINIALEAGADLGKRALEFAGKVRQQVGDVLSRIDWREAGQRVGEGLTRALGAISQFISQIDFSKAGQAIIRGIADFLKGVNWPAVLKATATLLVKAIIGLDKFLFAASKELGRQILIGIAAGVSALSGLVVAQLKKLPERFGEVTRFFSDQGRRLGRAVIDGVGRGLDNAKDAVIKKLLDFVNKILGVTGFLGRFDPFKGVRESVQKRLNQMQGDTGKTTAAIQKNLDSIHGKNVTVGVTEKGVAATQKAIDGIKGKNVLITIATKITQATTFDAFPDVRDQGFGGADASRQATAAVKVAQNQANAEKQAAERIAAVRRAAATATKRAAAAAAKARQEAVDAFAKLSDALSLKADIAASQAGFRGDIAVQNKIIDSIQQEIKIEGRTTDLLRQLFAARQKRAELQRSQRQGQQFKALGLTDDGQQKVASASALLKRTGSLKQQVKGTPLDTEKTRAELARITNVLKGKFGKAGKNVRASILGMLNDISSALNGGKSGDKKGPLTKFRVANFSNISSQFPSLSPADQKRLQQTLSRIGGSGTIAQGSRTGGAFGQAPRTTGGGEKRVIHVHVHLNGREIGSAVHQDDQRRGQRTSRSRTGPTAGRDL